MHILVTNDDGPPSSESSPYVHCLVRHLQRAGHEVSVCLPHTQRSWIGKAHMIGQTLKPLYYRPGSDVHGETTEGTTHHRPSPTGDVEEWVLIDGTPASCVQIGLFHFFQDRGPIDLVLSGPNYGRNTSSVFALSSGTVGAALEAAICRRRSIALSFAFFSRNHDPVVIEAACRHSIRVIDALCRRWPSDGSVDLYSVNVPLVEDVESRRTLYTDMLQNYWRGDSCFQEIDGETGDATQEEARIREGPAGEAQGARPAGGNGLNGPRAGHTHKHFKWAPRLTDVFQSVQESAPGNDGRTVMDGDTSVTPLKCNFAQAQGAFSRQELELSLDGDVASAAPKAQEAIDAVVAYDDGYVEPLVVSAFKSLIPAKLLNLTCHLPKQAYSPAPGSKSVHVVPYEVLDFEAAAAHPQTLLINSYMIRKALIRKHFLSATVDHWVAKKPDSCLARHVKRSEAFELDYAEFLDDALIEAFDLREGMQRNMETGGSPEQREWWILKPGMSDRGQGIRLFSSMDELQAIFDEWEEERPDSDGEQDEQEGGDYITTSHLRHFVAQPYIHPPLLLPSDPRKFHIRTYVLATGSLSVHVFRPMLALFAAKPYVAPWEHEAVDLDSHLTNTCLQGSSSGAKDSVAQFWDLGLPQATLESIFHEICTITGELFEAAARAMPVHFQTLPNAFEVFGLDFLVDGGKRTWLLEVNAFPDFRQTGAQLSGLVERFWKGVVREAVLPFCGIEGGRGDGDMVLVKRMDLGRRQGG
ncbi:hypothetical protein CDD81_2551 [Ophiocordyceps australis]|uniref:Survival protein SurE-like phosphatase/nucleotidase domain-containing protein n=1 Tax=Ophiocordyceps australis TaxID=1399860 RepID=A0A2C5XXY7_9HYPO|nr:hypothetical protein CDD81_2551 [Ophiocordyceps australis]